MRRVALIAACVVMAGCATSSSMPPRHAPLASRLCTGQAQQSVDDAAANNVEPAMQNVIFNDAYANCLHWQAKATPITRAP
jgi:hypothetical protein